MIITIIILIIICLKYTLLKRSTHLTMPRGLQTRFTYTRKRYWNLRKKQIQAARYCTNVCSREPGTVTRLLRDLQWDALQGERQIKRRSIIYKMKLNLLDIPLDRYIQHNIRSLRKSVLTICKHIWKEFLPNLNKTNRIIYPQTLAQTNQ